MKNPRNLGTLSLLFVALCLLPAQRASSNPLPQNVVISAEDASALSTLSEYMVGRVDLAQTLLRRHGYQPSVIEATWRQFPSVRKLETAYLAAEAAAPNRGGEKLLALLASDLAQEYESVGHERSLTEYLRKADAITTPVRFANRASAAPMPDLSRPVVAAIDTISQYCSRGPAGTPQSILRTHFRLSPDLAYQVLRESTSNAEAFKRAMTFVPEQERAPALKGLISQLAPKFEALRYEPTLKPFLEAPLPTPPSIQPFPPTPRPSVPAREPEFQSAAQKYPTFVRENYATAESMSFSVMAEAVEGFGGVVFGNQVSADPGLPRITSVSFDGSSTKAVGLLTYHFADQSALSFENVSLEDAYASYHMVFERVGGVEPTESGKGVGLISLDDNTPSFTCDKAALKVTESSKFNVVLHPALASLDLGWAAVMVDALPIEPDLIETIVRQSGAGEDQALAIKNLFLSMHTPSFVHNWKVVDVPLTVGSNGGALAVWRSGPDSSIPVGLRRTAFIEMRPMLEKGFDVGFARNFYQYVPILTRASRDYDRLNRFASVLAVVRLAKMEGAVFLSPPPAPQRMPTPDAIRISEHAITAVAPFLRGDALKAALSKSDKCIQEITNSSPVIQQKLVELSTLEEEHDKAKKTAYLADSGSAEETSANKEMRDLDTEIDQKVHQLLALPEGQYVLSLFVIADHISERLEAEELAASESHAPARTTRRRSTPQPQ
jgi:hypothetical protein